MNRFDPEMHTQDALARELEAIYAVNPDTLLAGSIGRASMLSYLHGDFQSEFEDRNALVRPDGTPRDIDVIDLPAGLAGGLRPFEVDADTFACQVLRIERQNKEWFLSSPEKGFEARLHPAVMEPVRAEVLGGVAVLTLLPQTHLELLSIKRGTLRSKDTHRQAALELVIQQQAGNQLPEELYQPFRALRQIWQEDTVVKARDYYRKTVPLGLRKRLRPVNRVVMKLLWHE